MSPSAHEALLSAAAFGDDAALLVLVREHHDRVVRFGARVCRDRFDAEDAVQEAFLKLARRPDVQRDAGALSWLFSVVRNACLRMLRPFSRERGPLGDAEEMLEERPSAAPSAEALLERFRLVAAVHAAIATLGREYREVLVLRDVEGLPGDEVQKTLGLSEAAMKSRLHRARGMVRERILDERKT